MGSRHQPVLAEAVVRWLAPAPGLSLLDATLGGGGHARRWLSACGGRGRLLALDQDPGAWPRSGLAGAFPEAEVRFLHTRFEEALAELAAGRLAGAPFDRILLDLGPSSDQLDDPARGLSFQHDGPLDMRLDPTRGEPASRWLERQDEASLTRVLRDYGEIPHARRLARRILAARPVTSTRQLARICEAAAPRRGRRSHHPATLCFQAIRIAVNRELVGLEQALVDAVRCLAPGGRLAVIAFHSLEDRIVKRTLRRLADPCICPKDLPACACGRRPVVRLLTRRAVAASAAEVAANPRARSA
ncbi:MAG: 16S rRNA (cytosine(1402)-N(4))-methyltransferase RsmH, partial [Nitrospirae bacterium]